MLLGLAMEYTAQINSKETPTVLTSLDRVVHSESQKIMDELEVEFKERISQAIPEDFSIISYDAETGRREDLDVREIFNNLRQDATKIIHTQLS
jgi:hypothetical protein